MFAALQPPQREAVVGQLCRLVPHVSDVGLQPTSPRAQQLRFRDRWQPSLWFTPWQVADSVLLLLALLVLPYQMPLPNVLTLDEPERGLPPRMLGELVGLLRQLSLAHRSGRRSRSSSPPTRSSCWSTCRPRRSACCPARPRMARCA